MDTEIKLAVESAVLCWLATVDPAEVPKVTPKEIFSLNGDDRLVIADIALSNSVRNISRNPSICVSFIDIFRQRRFKLLRTATIVVREDRDFAVVGAELLQLAGTIFHVRNIISVRIEQTSRIFAPSYHLVPDQTEEQRMHQAYRTYGVDPAHRSQTCGGSSGQVQPIDDHRNGSQE